MNILYNRFSYILFCIPKYLSFLQLAKEGQGYYLGYKYGHRALIKFQPWSDLANANSMLLLYKEDDGWIWSEGCNILVDPHLITFWLSLSKTELERSSPLWSAFGAAVLVSICSILTLLWTSEPLEKSIGEFLSSSNIPNDTKTEYN